MPFIVIVIFGALSACFALLIELSILTLYAPLSASLSPFEFSSVLMLLATSLIEEVSKFLFLTQYAKRFFGQTPSNLSGTFALGVLFSVGFILPELSLAVLPAPPSLWPLIGIAALHTTTILLLAFWVLYTKHKRPFTLASTLSLAILIHLVYNLLIAGSL